MKKIFRYPIKVSQEHIDSLNHVNNEVYIKWLLEAAGANSSSVGFTLDKFLSEEACFVVRRHEVDYLAPAFLDEELTVETWIEQMEATRSTRVYTIKRNKDDKTLIKAKTLWVYINLKNGRPIEIPEHIKEIFSPYIHN